jgi:hypothetical protein
MAAGICLNKLRSIGDRGPLDEALRNHVISREDAHHLIQRSKHTWLQDKVHNFSYQEVMQVYNASGATEQQKSELWPIIDSIPTGVKYGTPPVPLSGVGPHGKGGISGAM